MQVAVRTCTGCGETKDLAEFGPEKRSPDGRQARCRTCERARSRQRNHSPEVRARHKAWCEANREKVREYRNGWRRGNARQLAKRRAQYAAGPEPHRERTRRYYAEHAEEILARRLAKRIADPDSARATWRAIYERNPEAARRRAARWRAKFTPDELAAMARRWKRDPMVKAALESARRARLREAFVARIDLRELAARDEWTCKICRRPVDPTLTGTRNADRASLDHVVPLERGGTHEPGNAQLAHMRCNSRKGVRLMEELILECLAVA